IRLWIDDFQERPVINKMETAALSFMHHTFFTSSAEHRPNLSRAIHIVERAPPELLHTLGPFKRITAGRNKHPFEAMEVTLRKKTHLFAKRGKPRQIDGSDPQIMGLKRPHPLTFGFRVKD